MSLQLPWAVAFIAEGIGRDVNKVVGWHEITLLAKTKGKEANTERGKTKEARGDKQINSQLWDKHINTHCMCKIRYHHFPWGHIKAQLIHCLQMKSLHKHNYTNLSRVRHLHKIWKKEEWSERWRGGRWDGWSTLQRAEGEWWQVRCAHGACVSE